MQIALETGFAMPLGSATRSESFASQIGTAVPFTLEWGLWPTPHLVAGFYAAVSVGGRGNGFDAECLPEDAQCTGVTGRIGLRIEWQFAPTARLDPWVSYGFGVETAYTDVQSDDGDTHFRDNGFEFARVGAGFDYRVGRNFTIGPVVNLDLGEFTSQSVEEGDDTTASEGIPDPAIHLFFSVGVRISGVL